MRENCYLLRIGGGLLGALFVTCVVIAFGGGLRSWVLGVVGSFGLMLLAMAIFAPSKKLEKWFGGL